MRLRPAWPMLCLPLLLAPSAQAHSLVRPAGSVVTYLSADATSLNTLVITQRNDQIVFRDETVDGGIDPGSCKPGDLDRNEQFVVEVLCPAGELQRVRADLGEREDQATVLAAVPTTLLGGAGADRLTGGPAGDQLDGGAGADVLDGGAGDDELAARDGIADKVRCGDGSDVVFADQLDEATDDCERVERVAVPPPAGGSAADDKAAPRLRAAAPRVQRIGPSRRTVRVIAATSEAGQIAASGVLDVAGLALPAATVRRRVPVAGGGIELRYRLTAGQLRQALASLRRHRRVHIRLSVVATDLAGNSRQIDLPRIRLTR